jgi:hypothetical protein
MGTSVEFMKDIFPFTSSKKDYSVEDNAIIKWVWQKTSDLVGNSNMKIDRISFPWHIIIGDYILMDENIWVDKDNPNWAYYTFSEAQRMIPKGWYYIPSEKEWIWLYEFGVELWLWSTWKEFSDKLRLPLAGCYKEESNSICFLNNKGCYLSSNPSLLLSLNLSNVELEKYIYAWKYSLRCFKKPLESIQKEEPFCIPQCYNKVNECVARMR